MLKDAPTFGGMSVSDMSAAKEFYGNVLGLEANQDNMGLELKLFGGSRVFLYQKDDHQPATFTVLNFVVKDIDKTVDELKSRGVKFEIYDNMPAKQDDKGILRGLAAKMGPDIAWFKDPAGNILSILQDK